MAAEVATYRDYVIRYLRGARARPEMHFGSLGELETFLRGHAMGFFELGLLAGPDDAFHEHFIRWLWKKLARRAAVGWAHAVEEMAKEWEVDPTPVFFELYDTFLKDGGWPA